MSMNVDEAAELHATVQLYRRSGSRWPSQRHVLPCPVKKGKDGLGTRHLQTGGIRLPAPYFQLTLSPCGDH